MGRESELRLLRDLIEARMRGLKICNTVLEGEVPRGLEGLMESFRETEVRLISRLQRTIEYLMEER